MALVRTEAAAAHTFSIEDLQPAAPEAQRGRAFLAPPRPAIASPLIVHKSYITSREPEPLLLAAVIGTA